MKHISAALAVGQHQQLCFEQETLVMEGFAETLGNKFKDLVKVFKPKPKDLDQELKERIDAADKTISVLLRCRSELSSKNFESKPIKVSKYLKGFDLEGKTAKEVLTSLRAKLDSLEKEVSAELAEAKKNDGKFVKKEAGNKSSSGAPIVFTKKEVLELIDISVDYFKTFKALAVKSRNEIETIGKGKGKVTTEDFDLGLGELIGGIFYVIFQVVAVALQIAVIIFAILMPIHFLISAALYLIVYTVYNRVYNQENADDEY